jgi:SAM-dependent methyltransferase
MKLLSRLLHGVEAIKLSQFSLHAATCPFCGPTLIARLNNDEDGIRCIRCTASTIHLSIGLALADAAPNLTSMDSCEFSAAGPLVEYMRRRSRTLRTSEYYADTDRGSVRNDIRCEDMQQLTYADCSFDLITHTEVLEHVPDERAALSELHRVLRPGGIMIFTVPLFGPKTKERARLVDGGRIEHLEEPVYHTDPIRAGAGILAFRDYGFDIAERLISSGFHDVAIATPGNRIATLKPRPVVIARR